MKLKQPLSVLFWSSQNYSQYKKYECDHRFPSLLLPPSLLRFLSIYSPLIFLVLNFPALVSVYLVRHCKTFVLTLFQSLCSLAMFWRLDVHGKSYPPPWYKGGFMEPLNDMLLYFENILSLLESLWSSLQDEVYFIGGGDAGSLWRYQLWSLSWPPLELEIR